MKNFHKALEKCKHPNSRRTKALSKKAKRYNDHQKKRLGHAVKCNLIGEKLSWFLERIDEKRTDPLTPEEFDQLIQEYLQRFDEELKDIALKRSISKNRSNQHCARENAIKMTLEKERNDYRSGGMEMLNLCDAEKYKSLINWDGCSINVQHLKMDLISHNFIQRLKKLKQSKDQHKESMEIETESIEKIS